jgi:predicted AAA+ superfamily ATPase
MKMKRILYENIWQRLSAHKQMVFVAGPRQAGKTTFTQILAEDFNNSLYFNWDILDEKRKLIENPSFYEEVHRKDNSLPQKQPNKISMIFWPLNYALSSY